MRLCPKVPLQEAPAKASLLHSHVQMRFSILLSLINYSWQTIARMMYTSTNTFNSYRVVTPLLLHIHAIASFTDVLLSAAVVPSLLHNTYQFSSCLALSTFLLQWIITFSAFQRFFFLTGLKIVNMTFIIPTDAKEELQLWAVNTKSSTTILPICNVYA